ncbi:PucR family transcriptional regulator [Thermicanus aegyptius]|uniref:PucR family transcriptional regulator n=1 Tax=Thermicanus aegyptius TaxID=94009 RepID=UPI00048CD376|nr:helix-turn-helix domain-containing protein [Thermicanus aegyptius]
MDTPLTFQELLMGSPFHHVEILAGWSGKEKSFLLITDSLPNSKQAGSPCSFQKTNSLLPPEKRDPHRLPEEPPSLAGENGTLPPPLKKEGKASLLLLAAEKVNRQELPDFLQLEEVKGILLYQHETIYIPVSIREKIDNLGKPLLFLRERDEENLKRKIEEMSRMKALGLFHYVWEESLRYWLEMANRNPLHEMLRRLETLIGHPLLLLTPSFQLHPSMENAEEFTSFHPMRREYLRWEKQEKNYTFVYLENGGKSYYLFPIKKEGVELGFLLIRQEQGSITDLTLELVRQAVSALSFRLFLDAEIAETHKKYKNHFLHDLLFNQFDSEETLITQGRYWGWDFTKPVLLMVLEAKPFGGTRKREIEWEGIKSEAEVFCRRSSLNTVITPLQNQLVILLFDSLERGRKEEKEWLKMTARDLRRYLTPLFPETSFSVGIGRIYPSNLDLYRSYQEAKIALEMGKFLNKTEPVISFDELGLIRLLSYIHQEILNDFYREYLVELLEYDRENDGILMKTLEAFFRSDGDINRTADLLYIHPNTLRNRLKKIEHLLHLNLNSYEDLLNLFAALKIFQMVHKP